MSNFVLRAADRPRSCRKPDFRGANIRETVFYPCDMIRWTIVATFAAGLLCPRLQAQTDLQPGVEPCDQALRHASSAVLRYQGNLANQGPPNSVNQGSPVVRQHAGDYKEKVAIATDVIMHCELSTTPASEIQANLVHLYKGQPIEELGTSPVSGTANAGKQDKRAGTGMKIAGSTPAATPEMRVIELRFGDEDDQATLRLVFEPSKKMIDIITPTGKKVPTTKPDGFVRVFQ
jgi:hypothetical protein